MRRTLIISVGTGIGPGSDAKESLAHGLQRSINNFRPDHIIYVISPESRESMLPLMLEKNPSRDHQVVELKNVDDIQKIFNELRPIVEEARARSDELFIDFTSGTKAMTSSLAILGVLCEADVLCNVVGERRNGIVQMGTENVQSIPAGFAVAEKKLQTALSMFNRHHYESTLSLLEELDRLTSEASLATRVAKLRLMSRAYLEWDRFNHEEAFSHLHLVEDDLFSGNKAFLGSLLHMEGSREDPRVKKATYLLVDLLNNAMRRGDDEGKYDDAVARLYRAMELLAQRQLLTHGIDSSDVRPEDVPAELRRSWEGLFVEGSAKIGLAHCYELLTALGDPLGEFYRDEEVKELLSTRNSSILAHGLQSVNREVYVTLRDLVARKAKETTPKYGKLLEESKFRQMECL